jgi:hypothetical protein
MNKSLVKFFGTAIEVFGVIMMIVGAIALICLVIWGTWVLCAALWIHVSWFLSIAIGTILIAFFIALCVALFEQLA